jgi:RNA polymerase sigma factor (sigma-70 family)
MQLALATPHPVRDDLVRNNLGFVAWIARDYRHRGVPFEDLVAEGNLGLLEAAQRYDVNRGTKFTTYAAWWIRKTIRVALDGAPVVRRPSLASGGARPLRAVGLDDPAGVGARLADERSPDPESHLLDDETARRVRAAIVDLPPLERAVLEHRFGLEDRPLLSLRETGAALGLCGERVRQIERRSLDRMRRVLVRNHHLRPIDSPMRSGVSRSNFTASLPCGLR